MAGVIGTTGNDYLVDTLESDYIVGFEGNDYLSSTRGGPDTLSGGSGGDIINVDVQLSGGTYQITGDDDPDWISVDATYFRGNYGDYTSRANVDGGNGADSIFVYGGGWTDIYGNVGYSTVTGGEGDDTIGFYGGIFNVNAGSGNDQLYLGISDQNPFPVSPYGRTGENISGSVTGGVDHDVYTIGSGVDLFSYVSIVENPNEGFDKIAIAPESGYTYGFTLPNNIEALEIQSVNSYTGSATFVGNAESNYIFFSDGATVADGVVTKLYGRAGDDSILGTKSAKGDQLYGEVGNDYLFGDEGNDTLDGGSEHDWLLGGNGKDKLVGGTGNDSLTGGTGSDTLTGGLGADMFGFETPREGSDQIKDFNSQDDNICIFSYQFPVSGFTGQSGTAISSNLFRLGTTALDSDDRFIYNRSMGQLFFDQDGKGGTSQVLLATLSNNPSLSASDIIVF